MSQLKSKIKEFFKDINDAPILLWLMTGLIFGFWMQSILAGVFIFDFCVIIDLWVMRIDRSIRLRTLDDIKLDLDRRCIQLEEDLNRCKPNDA